MGNFDLDDVCNCSDIGSDAANSRGIKLSPVNTFIQYSASTPSATSFIDVIHSYDSSGNWASIIDVAIGGAGSEVVIIPNLAFTPQGDGANHGTTAHWCFPIYIPEGTRISARCTFDQTNTFAQILTFSGFAPSVGSGVDTIGWSSNPTNITPNASANTKGSYTALTASSSRDYLGFVIATMGPGQTSSAYSNENRLLDIAIGSAGNEIPIISNYFMGRQSLQGVSPFYPIFIPAGTRISARIQSDGASAAASGITLYAVYK